MGTKLIVIVFICLSITYSSLGYPRSSDSDSNSDEDTQQQQQQNLDSESHEQFVQKIQAIKGRQRPEKVQKVEEEEPEPYDRCLDPKKTEPCKAHIPRYFFNKDSGNCEIFAWGGCGKNGNNFREFSECESSCAKHILKARLDEERDSTTSHASTIEICEKSPVKNPDGMQCLAYIPRWTYNSTQEQCVEYIWGGCGKTENNFATESLCEESCGQYPNLKGRGGGGGRRMPTPRPTRQEQQHKLGPETCDLPSDPGLCLAIFEKYYFNKVHNRCELFIYGGCGGNKNRFDKAEDCVRACGGDSPSKDPECIDVECPWALYGQYESLGCSPIYDGDSCCPTRYECSVQQPGAQNNTLDSRSLTLEREDEEEPGTNSTTPGAPDEVMMSPKCRYRGKMYNVGEMVDEASDTGSCRAGCRCADSRGGSGGYEPRIVCAQIECPRRPRGKERCIPLYKRGACCPSDYHCTQGELTVIDPSRPTHGNEPPLAKCNVNGEAVYEGQRFYPAKSPCSKCLCEKTPANATSLEGQLHCERVDCGIEIYYSHYLAQGCAPVYYEKGDGTTSCCPITWECPDNKQDESDNEDNANTTPEAPQPPRLPSTDSPLPPMPQPPPPTPPAKDKPKSPLTRSHEDCSLEKVEGDCKGHRPSFYYNGESGKCESFVYTGCRGNLNNFASHEDCKNLCESTPPLSSIQSGPPPAKGGKTTGGLLTRSGRIDETTPSTQEESKAISLTEVDPCTLPKRVGRCKGYFPRFYYSPEENQCELFIFGGCRPNANNFYSKDSCEATCLNKIPVENLRTNLAIPMVEQRTGSESNGDSSRVNFGDDKSILVRSRSPPTRPTSASTEEVDLCGLPPRTGRCKAYVRRFYYDTDTKMCKQFTYGGCSGNNNNFKTFEECDQRCGMDSRTIGIQGMPGSSGQGWRITGGDSPTGANRESSQGAPTALPPSTSFTARCKLPKAQGSCYASIRSYYYDVETKSCKLFFYSGCFGNANRFITREDCENLCKKPLQSEGGSSANDQTTNPPNRPRVHELSEGSTTETSANRESQEKAFCKEDPAPGNCNEKQLRFYYDSVAEHCLPFVFSGCSGNKNNFVTEAECMSSCGNKPTLEQLADEMVLSCTFGNRTVPLGGTVGKNHHQTDHDDDYNGEEPPCGVPVCQCITPPAVTCVQRMCPEPTTTERPKPCPAPSCLRHCRVGTGPDGCPTCDCDDRDRTDQTETVIKQGPVKSVKG